MKGQPLRYKIADGLTATVVLAHNLLFQYAQASGTPEEARSLKSPHDQAARPLAPAVHGPDNCLVATLKRFQTLILAITMSREARAASS